MPSLFCTPPVTKNPDCLAVVRVLPVVCAKLAAAVGLACDGTPSAEGAGFSVHPDGNHGDNQIDPTDKAVL